MHDLVFGIQSRYRLSKKTLKSPPSQNYEATNAGVLIIWLKYNQIYIKKNALKEGSAVITK